MSTVKTKSKPPRQAADPTLTITRVFDAPRSLVFQAWTEPERVQRWWGPKGFTTPVCEIDLRVGGVSRNCMRSPEGQDFWSRGVYREIVEPERIVCTDSFADEQGHVVSPEHYGLSPEWPVEALITVTFTEQAGKTRLTLQHSLLPPGRERDLCRQGWEESFDKLADYLAQASHRQTQKITPCLWFDDRAEEAVNFYVSVFPNSKIETITRYGPAAAQAAGRPEGTVLTILFQLSGQRFMALNGGPVFTFSPAISFMVDCRTQEEVDELWERLSDGGEVQQCGWLQDRYGVSWQIVPTVLGEMLQDKDAEKSERVMKAMLQMKKLDIRTLKQAYEQEPAAASA
jgi:predicted 3-demethylubiquinone-9 3-methyltransferase (glyoxalase superfamily)/uncharacterized protein YndB with AHSA1/START domain